MKVNYDSIEVPKDYVCKSCGNRGVKLWRMGSTFTIELVCASCASKLSNNRDISDMDQEGRYSYDFDGLTPPMKTDQIGSYVPAVPTEDGSDYYWYCSVPFEGVEWWKRLPNFPFDISHMRVAV
jgi:hypothetical protein